ncbi:MAG: hypothetical protein IH996_06290 [Proteobacteria bacterium]|nr:hypothetical protein [Pseudomonadota bacterium]
MKKTTRFTVLGALLFLVIGAVVLMFWDIPAPTEHVERKLPDENFPR